MWMAAIFLYDSINNLVGQITGCLIYDRKLKRRPGKFLRTTDAGTARVPGRSRGRRRR